MVRGAVGAEERGEGGGGGGCVLPLLGGGGLLRKKGGGGGGRGGGREAEEREGDGTCVDRMSNFVCSTKRVCIMWRVRVGCNSLHRNRIDRSELSFSLVFSFS